MVQETQHSHPAHEAGAHGDEHSHVPTKYRSGTTAVVALFALLVAVGLGVAWFHGHHSRDKAAAELKAEAERLADAPPPVNVMHVHRAGSDRIITLPGEVRADIETTIFARTSGYLKELKVDIGDRIEEGQVLATIDAPELDDQLAAARAKVDELKANVQVAQTNMDFAKVSADRWAGAAPEGVVSEQERDQKRSELEASKAKLESAKAQVVVAQAEVQRLMTLFKFKTVTAPFKGTITQRHADVGALVTAGSTNNTTSLFTLSQYDQVRVIVHVPQAASANIKVGMPVTAEAREYPGQTFTGKVERTAEAIDPVARTLRVEVLIPNKDHLLISGMALSTTFRAGRSNPPVEVPAAALCLKTDGPHVAVVGDDGKISYRSITIARDLGDAIEVATGLNGDETVALNIGSDVAEGGKIETRLVEQPASPGAPTGATRVTAASGNSVPSTSHDVVPAAHLK